MQAEGAGGGAGIKHGEPSGREKEETRCLQGKEKMTAAKASKTADEAMGLSSHGECCQRSCFCSSFLLFLTIENSRSVLFIV